jgi:hypothetical protein
MKITAISTIIEWDAEAGRMVVLNPGESGIVSDSLGRRLLGSAPADGDDGTAPLSQLDHDGDGNPGGSVPHDPPALKGKNKAELLAIAEAEGVAVEEGATNKAIADAIEAHRAAQTDGDDGTAPAF